MSIAQKLQSMGITLPPVSTPAAAYLPYVQSGSLVFLSGHIAKKDGAVWVGQLGRTMVTSEGQQAARAVAIDLLGTLQAACQAAGTTLDGVARIVKVMSLVNSTPDFTNTTWSPMAAANCLVKCSGRPPPMRAALLAWPNCPWGPASKSK